MRVLIIGYGSMGRRHAANARLMGHQVGLFDTAPLDAAASAYAAVFATFEEALAWGSHAAVISTPAHTHLSYMWQLAAKDIRFLVEKPVAPPSMLSEAEAFEDRYAEQPDRCGMFFVGYNLRFHSAAMALRLGADGQRPSHAQLRMLGDIQTWPGSAKNGDPLLECSHEIDLARWLRFGGLTRATIGTSTATLRFESDCSVDLNWGWTAGYHRRWALDARHFGGSASFSSGMELGERMYYDELCAFLNLRADGSRHPSLCTIADGVDVMRICAAARRLSVLKDGG